MTRRLKEPVGTLTAPDCSDHRTRYDLVGDEVHTRTARARALNQFRCPTCHQAPGDECRTRTGQRLHGTSPNHKRREDLLWCRPCPTCGVEVGEFCVGRAPGINHRARDMVIHAAIPGSEFYPAEEKISWLEASRWPEDFPTITRWAAAAGRVPWQTRQEGR